MYLSMIKLGLMNCRGNTVSGMTGERIVFNVNTILRQIDRCLRN